MILNHYSFPPKKKPNFDIQVLVQNIFLNLTKHLYYFCNFKHNIHFVQI